MRTTATTLLAPTATVTKISVANNARSTWHSPIPYLFGGLAAIMTLIVFALLILACSYWKNSGDDGDENRENKETEDAQQTETVKVFEEKILVVMAGDQKPTFLATPSCFANAVSNGEENSKRQGDFCVCEKLEKENGSSRQQEY